MVEGRIIPGMQKLISAETATRTRVAVERLLLLQRQARDEKSGMVIDAASTIFSELPAYLRQMVSPGESIIIDRAGLLIFYPNGKK